MIKLMNAKGTRDISPQEKIQKENIIKIVKKIFEQYGYFPLETPILTRKEVLFAKYSGGDEIIKETFTFKDRGDRELGLRYDLTVPFAKYISLNPNIKFPFRRYEIGKVFRDGPIKTGRFREFWQCDVDIVGVDSIYGEIELMLIASKIFDKLGLNVIMEINSIQILKSLLKSIGVGDNKIQQTILILDKLKKIPKQEIVNELKQQEIDSQTIELILKIFDTNLLEAYENTSKISKLNELTFSKFADLLKDEKGKNELNNLQRIILKFNELNKTKNFNLIFNPSLARGLSYYTGTIFEAFLSDRNSNIKSSLCGGGRYDNMISEYVGETNKKYPTVGMTIGLDVINEAIKKIYNEQNKKSNTLAYIIPINTLDYSLSIAERLREQGINVGIDIQSKSISKNLSYLNYYSIPFAIIIGEEEISQGTVKLKDMVSGKEEEVKIDFLIQYLKNIENQINKD